MYHDAELAARAKEPCPASAVSAGVGLAGLAGMGLWLAVARWFAMSGPFSALTNLAACAVPMILWSLLVDKVHRHAGTGIEWANPKPWRETLDLSLTKLAGLWTTWVGIALIYFTGRFYWTGQFGFAMWCLIYAAPVLFALSIPYVLWLDRRLANPRDGCWALGAWLMGLQEPIDREAIWNHLRSWGVKAFFVAFMLAVVPAGFGQVIDSDWRRISSGPVAFADWLVALMFTVDVGFATVGYVLTLRPLDSHIRTANPYAAAWMAALICYPPFILMNEGGPLDYHPGTADWTHWLAGLPALQWGWAGALVVLTAIYAWATVAFGLRFSNLTHRGILTHGPYRFSRHPAYLSKNLFWWMTTLPFLTTGSWVDGLRATILMAAVSGVYYWRAKTEEWHLGADPAYQAYSGWMARHGLVPRFFGWLGGRSAKPAADVYTAASAP